MEAGRGERFRILSADGGGIRGLIPAMVLRELEQRLRAATGEERPLADYFHLLSGTSTGGLIALGLTAPDPGRPGAARMDGEQLVSLYRDEGPRIFTRSLGQRLRSFDGLRRPKHSNRGLEEVVRERLGDARLSAALRDLVVVAYDVENHRPRYFKRWRAKEDAARDVPMADAGMATSAAPTYLPSWEVGGETLVDGGVFANNPTIAAVAEALKRRGDEPKDLRPHELFVVSLGTGVFTQGFEHRDVRKWGGIDWIKMRGSEPALLRIMLDGQTAAADHWAHTILNHDPGDPLPAAETIGRGPRYYRFEKVLPADYAMDDAGGETIEGLGQTAEELIAERSADLDAVVARLAAAGPIPPSPGGQS